MIDKMRSRMESESGFTLIELLVVILIIGILAAIAIPSFLNQREKGQDTCAKTQARTMATAMETYYTDHNSYTASLSDLNQIESAVVSVDACGDGTLAAVGPSAGSEGACAAGNTGTQTGYCVSQTSASGGMFSVSRAANVAAVRNCGPAARVGKGGCPTGGKW